MMSLDDAGRLRHLWRDHDKTRPLRAETSAAGIDDAKGAETLQPGALLEVHCTDPLSVIDIPNLIQEVGGKIEITKRGNGASRS